MSAKVATRNAAIGADNGLTEGHEKSLLAYLMSGRAACDKLLNRVCADVFSVPSHRAIIDGIFDIYDERDEINHITVSDRLNQKGKLAECGGVPAIIEISLSTTSAEIAGSALDCILELIAHAKLRRLVNN
jgi:replicative DNA helicase